MYIARRHVRKERGHVPGGAFTSRITFYTEPNGERRSDTLSENPLRKIKALRGSATRCRRPRTVAKDRNTRRKADAALLGSRRNGALIRQ